MVVLAVVAGGGGGVQGVQTFCGRHEVTWPIVSFCVSLFPPLRSLLSVLRANGHFSMFRYQNMHDAIGPLPFVWIAMCRTSRDFVTTLPTN